MTLDNEQQRQLLLELIKQVNFPGSAIELAYDLKRAISNASVEAVMDRVLPTPTLGRQE